MSVTPGLSSQKSRLGALLDHFATIDDPRDVRRIAHPLAEVLLLVVCGTIADCDDYDHIAAWGDAHLDFLRRHLPYEHGIPGGRWLTILMNRINPALFSAAFTAWVCETWPERPEFVTSPALSGTASWPSTRRLVVAKAETRAGAVAPPSARSWLRREVFPSMAGWWSRSPPPSPPGWSTLVRLLFRYRLLFAPRSGAWSD